MWCLALITPLSIRQVQDLKGELKNSKRMLVIHHWDSDGIASAALIGRFASKLGVDVRFHVPKIGLYSIEAIDLKLIDDYEPDVLLILDYGIPLRDVEKIERVLGVNVVVIDHHLNEVRSKGFFNPVAYGSSEDEYPSTTWVLRDLIDVRESLDLVALGVVGDLGKRLEVKKFKGEIERYALKFGLTLNDLYRASELVDSCYRLFDYDMICHARDLLKREGVNGVLRSCLLDEELQKLKFEVENAYLNLRLIKDGGLIKVFELKSHSYITSLIGRGLANKFENSIVMLVHKVEGLNLTYVYVRSNAFNLRGVLEALKKSDVNVGGKDQVFVVTCPSDSNEHVERVYDLIVKVVGDVK